MFRYIVKPASLVLIFWGPKILSVLYFLFFGTDLISCSHIALVYFGKVFAKSLPTKVAQPTLKSVGNFALQKIVKLCLERDALVFILKRGMALY